MSGRFQVLATPRRSRSCLPASVVIALIPARCVAGVAVEKTVPAQPLTDQVPKCGGVPFGPFDQCGLYLSASLVDGAAAPRARVPQPDAQTISPTCRLPRAANSLRLPILHFRCGRKRCGRPTVACPIAVKAAMGAT